MIYAESLRHRGQAKAAFSGLAARGRSNPAAIALPEVTADPTIYLIPGCDSEEDVHAFLRELCEEIFVEQLAGWLTDEETWPQDRNFDVFCRWFDWQHCSMPIDLCDEPLTDESD